MRWCAFFLLSFLFIRNADATCVWLDERLGYRFTPNCEGVNNQPGRDYYHFRFNKLGLRDRDYSPHPSKDVFRILYLGASNMMDFTYESGVAPAARRIINSLLRDKAAKGFLRKYIAVEIISGAEGGYHLINSFLRADELLAAYHPHLIVLEDTFDLLFSKEMYDHKMTQERENGLAKKLGKPTYSWPLSESFVWSLPGTLPTYVSSLMLGLKILGMKLKYFFTQSDFCSVPDPNCLVNIHMAYLDAFSAKAKKSGAHFLVAFNSVNSDEESMRKYVGWNDAGYISERLLHLAFLSVENRVFYRKKLESWGDSALDVTDLYQGAFNRQARFNINDSHYNEETANWLGEQIGQRLFLRIDGSSW